MSSWALKLIKFFFFFFLFTFSLVPHPNPAVGRPLGFRHEPSCLGSLVQVSQLNLDLNLDLCALAPPPAGAHQPTRDSPLASCEEGTCSGATKLRLSFECQRVFGEQGRGGGMPGSLWGQTRTNVNRGAGSQRLLSHTVCPDQTLKIPQRLGVGNGTLGDTSAV